MVVAEPIQISDGRGSSPRAGALPLSLSVCMCLRVVVGTLSLCLILWFRESEGADWVADGCAGAAHDAMTWLIVSAFTEGRTHWWLRVNSTGNDGAEQYCI